MHLKTMYGRALGVAAVGVFSLLSSSALACSVCGCGDPLVVAGNARPLAGNLRLAIDSEYLTASAASDDNPEATESVTQYTLRPVAVWSPLDVLSLVLQVPLVQKDWRLTGGGESPLTANSTGLGDVDAGARWFLWQQSDLRNLRRQNFALTGGTSLPTGPDDLRVNGERIDDHAQLGTGAFGPYLGALYAFHQDPWNLSVDVSVRAHSVNRFGYQYGVAGLWSVLGTYRLLDPFAVTLGVDGRYALRDWSNADLQANTGGLLLAAVPGLAINVFDNLWLHARAQIPIFTHLFGQQTVGPVFSLSLQYSFAG
jgi:hypothetical protein